MPRNNLGEIARTWTFESSSGNGLYETIQYTDGSTSCDCKGWTRRVDANGLRSCKHTRWVEQGVADRHAIGSKSYAPVSTRRSQPQPQPQRRVEPTPATSPPSRFKPKERQEEPLPKRRFEKVGVNTDVNNDADLVDADRFRRL